MEKFTWKNPLMIIWALSGSATHHVWFFEEKREIAVEKTIQYFLEHGIGVEKSICMGFPLRNFSRRFDEVENSGIAHITDPVGENMQFFPKGLDRTRGIRKLLEN